MGANLESGLMMENENALKSRKDEDSDEWVMCAVCVVWCDMMWSDVCCGGMGWDGMYCVLCAVYWCTVCGVVCAWCSVVHCTLLLSLSFSHLSSHLPLLISSHLISSCLSRSSNPFVSSYQCIHNISIHQLSPSVIHTSPPLPSPLLFTSPLLSSPSCIDTVRWTAWMSTNKSRTT